MIDYAEFWNLNRRPFEADANPAFFFESRGHGEALARLMYLVSDEGMNMGALTGEIGSGKTMTLAVLVERLPRDHCTVVRIPSAHLRFPDLLQEALSQLCGRAPQPGADPYLLGKEFERALEERIVAPGRHLLLMLDEAQFLADDCLEPLKCLTNLNVAGRPALTVLLSGQPDLRERLRGLPQVFQRLGMFYHLELLRFDEVAAYLTHRLRVAGATHTDVFDPECVQALYDFSRGCPRQINRVCKLAVDRACLMQQSRITSQTVRAIVDDIGRHFG